MALENYMEMRESVADPEFQLQQALSLELERRFPQRFIPRYFMVMYHREIPYLIVRQRSAVSLSKVNFDRAKEEIESRLDPLAFFGPSIT